MRQGIMGKCRKRATAMPEGRSVRLQAGLDSGHTVPRQSQPGGWRAECEGQTITLG